MNDLDYTEFALCSMEVAEVESSRKLQEIHAGKQKYGDLGVYWVLKMQALRQQPLESGEAF